MFKLSHEERLAFLSIDVGNERLYLLVVHFESVFFAEVAAVQVSAFPAAVIKGRAER